ncbi:MAG: hypothetical protein WAT93_00650 [Pontixanthobacter sp.]
MWQAGKFQFVRIVLFAVFAAVIYGILHDLVTAHLSLEYFTIAHPPLPLPQTSLAMALAWGVIATWWFGAILGIALGFAAQIGKAPKIDFAELKRPIILLMVASGVCAALAMVIGALLFQLGVIWVGPMLENAIPSEKHQAFLAAAWAHSASYLIGGIGGLFLVARTALRRYRLSILQSASKAENGI